MKKLLLSLFLAVCSLSAFAGQPDDPQSALPDLSHFAAEVSKAGNFSLAVSPGYAPKLGNGEWGLAIFGGYQFNQFAGAYLRADLFDGNYTIASGSITAQYPINFGKITVRPFVEAGVGSTLGGDGDNNKKVFAIAGAGAAVDVWRSKDGRQSLSAIVAVETWQPTYTGISIYRAAAAYTIHF